MPCVPPPHTAHAHTRTARLVMQKKQISHSQLHMYKLK